MSRRWAWMITLLSVLSLSREAAASDAGPSFVNEGVVAAPIAEVWKVWATAEGWRALGLAKVELDLRVGGLIRSHYEPEGTLGDPQTIQNRILAFEPPRMLAIAIDKPQEKFPFEHAWRRTWTVITLESVEAGRTRVRIASLGFGPDEESQAMRRFFEKGNESTLQTLKAHFGGKSTLGARAPESATP